MAKTYREELFSPQSTNRFIQPQAKRIADPVFTPSSDLRQTKQSAQEAILFKGNGGSNDGPQGPSNTPTSGPSNTSTPQSVQTSFVDTTLGKTMQSIEKSFDNSTLGKTMQSIEKSFDNSTIGKAIGSVKSSISETFAGRTSSYAQDARSMTDEELDAERDNRTTPVGRFTRGIISAVSPPPVAIALTGYQINKNLEETAYSREARTRNNVQNMLTASEEIDEAVIESNKVLAGARQALGPPSAPIDLNPKTSLFANRQPTMVSPLTKQRQAEVADNAKNAQKAVNQFIEQYTNKGGPNNSGGPSGFGGDVDDGSVSA